MSENIVPAWEASKENVIPIKTGRSAKGLSELLKSSDNELRTQQEQQFELDLKKETNTPSDTLAIYVKYFKWLRDVFPSRTDKVLAILERCTCELKGDDTLKNNQKFVKMWIEYADLVKTPGEIFSFMHTNKIGERVSLYWIAWAYVAEKAGNNNLADQIFQKGIKRLAEPKDILKQRYHQFQRRLARQLLKQTEEGTIEYETQQNAEAVEPKRHALSSLSKSQAKGVYSRATNDNGGNMSEPLPQQKLKSTSNQTNSKVNSIVQVYQDVPASAINSNNEFTNPLLRDNGSNEAGSGWKNLGTEAQRSKENTGVITSWASAPLAVPSNHHHHRSVSGGVSNSTTVPAAATSGFIPIYIEEEFQHKPSTKEHSKDQELIKDTLVSDGDITLSATLNTTAAESNKNERNKKILSVRSKLDSVSSCIEAIAKNPLQRHLQQQEATATIVVDTERKSSIAQINNNAQFEIYSDDNTTSSKTNLISPTTTASTTSSFAIFEDRNNSIQSSLSSAAAVATNTTANNLTKPANGFAIFQNSTAVPVASSVTNKNAQQAQQQQYSKNQALPISNSSSNHQGIAQPQPSFQIFTDNEPKVMGSKQSNKKFDNKTTVSVQQQPQLPPSSSSFTIFSDNNILSSHNNNKIANSTQQAKFQIFSDTNNDNNKALSIVSESKSQVPSKVPSSSNSNKAPKSIGGSSSFEIFNDDNNNIATTQKQPQQQRAKSSHDKVVSNNNKSNKVLTKEEAEELELQAMLDTMVNSDNNDETINTRLARENIDELFFSPTITNKNKSILKTSEDQFKQQQPKYNPLKPVGMNISEINELSAIREVSHEHSIFGNISTPTVDSVSNSHNNYNHHHNINVYGSGGWQDNFSIYHDPKRDSAGSLYLSSSASSSLSNNTTNNNNTNTSEGGSNFTLFQDNNINHNNTDFKPKITSKRKALGEI